MDDLDVAWRLDPGLPVNLNRDAFITQDGDFHRPTLIGVIGRETSESCESIVVVVVTVPRKVEKCRACTIYRHTHRDR